MAFSFDDAYNAAEDLLGRNLTPERRERAAFIDESGTWTYAQLADRAARFAGLLGRLRVRPEQRVALILNDTIDFPTAFLGAIQHGAVPIPLNTRLTTKDYRYILADSRACAVVVSSSLTSAVEGLPEELEGLEHVLVAGTNGDFRARLEASTPVDTFAPTRRGDMAFWLYTSGTTGQPKGAVHAQSHLAQTAELYAEPVLGITADDVVYSAAKLFFAYGLGNALTFPMAVGACAVLLEGAPTPDAVTTLLKKHDPTLFFGVPTLFGMLLSKPELLPDETRLRLCVSAGEALPPELLRRWKDRMGVDILDGLGSTEALHIFLSNRQGAVKEASSGRAVEGYALRLVDDDDREVADGEPGHLEVSGPTTAMFYWNQRERTKNTFRGRWMRTGDKYRRDEEGYFFYEGRSDDLMKVGGIWVSPFEVESALLEHEAVLEAAVVAHGDDDELIKPKAFVVLKDGKTVDEPTLIAFVRERLAPYKRPRWVTFVDELPKTATGKIQRFKLRA